MQIKDMFRKKIDREIQGVIIVGQGEETNVAQELEEYVVTRELQRHFADFFAAYKKGIQGTTPKMGVWISGFFGSGKSHFLKILSYLLQNKQVGDKHAIDYFIEDQKITNQMVLADMQLAANTPSDVILFNIDSKSDSDAFQCIQHGEGSGLPCRRWLKANHRPISCCGLQYGSAVSEILLLLRPAGEHGKL